MADSVSQVDKIYMPFPACVLSALPLRCIHSMTPPNMWGLCGRWGVCVSNTVTDYMPAMSDPSGFRFPLILTGSSSDTYITLHVRFQGIKIVTQVTELGIKLQMKHIK